MKNYFIFVTLMLLVSIGSLVATPEACGDSLPDSTIMIIEKAECDTTASADVKMVIATLAKVPIALTSIENSQIFYRYYANGMDLGYGTIIKGVHEKHVWIVGNTSCNHMRLKKWYEQTICAQFSTNRDLGNIDIAHYIIPI